MTTTPTTTLKTTRARVLLAAVLSLAAASGTRLLAQDAAKSAVPSADDPIDTTSDEAKKLADKLHVAPNWRAKAGTVDLVYHFAGKKTELLEDWKFSSLDKAELAGPLKREPNPTHGLDLAASTNSAGTAILDSVELLGDFTLDVQLKVSSMGPSSDVIFLVGMHDHEALGVRYGQQFVKVKKSGVSSLTHNTVVLDKFASSKTVDVKITRKGDDLSSTINGVEAAKKTFSYKELDGKIGFFLSSNVRIRVSKLELKGVIAIPK